MAPSLIFFLSALSFLSGIVFSSLGLSLSLALVPAAIVFAVLFAQNVDMRIAVLAAILLVAGSFYYL